MKSYSKIIIGFVIGIAALALVAYGTLALVGTGDDDVVTIGITTPLSGPLAEYGEAYRNGMTLALDEHASRGEQKVRFVFEDHQYDSAKAVGAFEKLVTIDHAVVVADWGTGPSSAIAPLVQDRDIVFITNSVDPGVTRESDRIVRNFYRPDEIATELWAHFRAVGMNDIAIIKVNILYFNEVTSALQAQAREGERVVVLDTVSDFGVSDFRTNVLKVQQVAGEYDTLGVFLGAGQIATFYKQLHDQGVSMQTFGSDFFESETEIAAAEGLMEGAVYANIGASPEFIAKYQARYGNTNQVSFAASGYDLVTLLLTQVDFTSTDTIMQSLRNIHGVPGVVGEYTYTETADDRYLKSPVRMKVIRDGKIEEVVR